MQPVHLEFEKQSKLGCTICSHVCFPSYVNQNKMYAFAINCLTVHLPILSAMKAHVRASRAMDHPSTSTTFCNVQRWTNQCAATPAAAVVAEERGVG